MGRLFILRVVAGLLLGGSVALAQQGLIVEPWRSVAQTSDSARLAPTTSAALGVMPGSGLPPPATRLTKAREANLAVLSARAPWTPPVVALLVDPWAKSRRAVAVNERARVPMSAEIVDPWAAKSRAVGSSARAPAIAPHSTIF